MKRKWSGASLALLSTMIALEGAAQVPATSPPPGYSDAGIKPVNPLPAIIAELRRTMKDPYSIRDFSFCEPKVSPAFQYPSAGQRWEKAHWKVEFALNAENGFGGYAGRTYFSADFENGRLTSLGSPNLGPELNSKLLDLVKDCPSVPDAEIQRYLQGGGAETGASERGKALPLFCSPWIINQLGSG